MENLGSLLTAYGELLPLSCDNAKLAIFNPTTVLDALDEAASSVMRLSSGEIYFVKRYVFRPEVVVGVDIFKITSLRISPTFVGERFVEVWKSSGLTGLQFREVWSAD